jgi:hypothetical protein
MTQQTHLFRRNGYDFFAHWVEDAGCYEVTIDVEGENFIGITADSIGEAAKYAREWLAEMGA